MAESLKVHKLVVERIKNIKRAEIECSGKHVVLSGKNGAGKSAIMLALWTALRGSLGLKKEFSSVVQQGEESGFIMTTIGDKSAKYTITADVLQDNSVKLKVKEFTDDGKLKIIPGGAVEFLNKIIIPAAFDASAFRKMEPSQQVETVMSMTPGLKPLLLENEKKYKYVQDERSRINDRIKEAEVDANKIEFSPGIPDQEVDAAVILKRLEAAAEYNKQQEGFDSAKRSIMDSVQKLNSDVAILMGQIDQNKQAIAKLQKVIELDTESIAKRNAIREELAAKLEKITEDESGFVAVSLEPIKQELISLNVTNEKIRNNNRKKILNEKVLQLKGQFSDGLKKMKAIEEERSAIFETHPTPVAGLTIKNGQLYYPHPDSLDEMPINSLSTGEFWSVALQLYAATLVKSSQGSFRAMFVSNVTELDEDNLAALFSEADRLNIQLLIHETIMNEESDGISLVIKDEDVVPVRIVDGEIVKKK